MMSKTEQEKYKQREYALVAGKTGFQFYAVAMEKQSLTQGQGHKEMLRRVAAHRHGRTLTRTSTTSTRTRWVGPARLATHRTCWGDL